MSIISFETKSYKSGALLLSSRPNLIAIRIHKIGSNNLNECYVPIALLDEVKQIKNHTALVAYAKANQITDSASDAHSGSDSASVPSCPAPVLTPAKSSEQERGILKCLQCNKFTNGYELDANNGYCNTCYAEPEQLPDQRYYSQSRFASLSEMVPVRSYPKSDYLRYESYPVNNSQLPSNLE